MTVCRYTRPLERDMRCSSCGEPAVMWVSTTRQGSQRKQRSGAVAVPLWQRERDAAKDEQRDGAEVVPMRKRRAR